MAAKYSKKKTQRKQGLEKQGVFSEKKDSSSKGEVSSNAKKFIKTGQSGNRDLGTVPDNSGKDVHDLG